MIQLTEKIKLNAAQSIRVLFDIMSFSELGRWMYPNIQQSAQNLHQKCRYNRPFSADEIKTALDYIEMCKNELEICEKRLKEIGYEKRKGRWDFKKVENKE